MPYAYASQEKRLSGKFVSMNGDFVPLKTPIPYSSLGAYMAGQYAKIQIMRPPYRSGSMSGLGRMGCSRYGLGDATTVAPAPAATDFITTAENWISANPIVAAGVAIGAAVLLFGGGRRR